MEFIDPKLQEYAEEHSTEEPQVLKELTRETHLKVVFPRMLSGHLQGQFYKMITQILRPKRILEVGTYTGYSTICFAMGLDKDAVIDTIDINPELEEFATYYFKKAGVDHQINFIHGDALKLIPSLKHQYDLVFLDADKENYPNYFDLVLDKMPSGGVILADNVLWSGKVIEDTKKSDHETEALIEFNTKVKEDNRVEQVVLPLRDGITLIRKK